MRLHESARLALVAALIVLAAAAPLRAQSAIGIRNIRVAERR